MHKLPAQYLGPKGELEKLLRQKSGLLLPGAIYEDAECDIQGSRGWTPETSIVKAGPQGGWKVESHFLIAPKCMPHDATVVPQRVSCVCVCVCVCVRACARVCACVCVRARARACGGGARLRAWP